MNYPLLFINNSTTLDSGNLQSSNNYVIIHWGCEAFITIISSQLINSTAKEALNVRNLFEKKPTRTFESLPLHKLSTCFKAPHSTNAAMFFRNSFITISINSAHVSPYTFDSHYHASPYLQEMLSPCQSMHQFQVTSRQNHLEVHPVVCFVVSVKSNKFMQYRSAKVIPQKCSRTSLTQQSSISSNSVFKKRKRSTTPFLLDMLSVVSYAGTLGITTLLCSYYRWFSKRNCIIPGSIYVLYTKSSSEILKYAWRTEDFLDSQTTYLNIFSSDMYMY